MLSLAGAKGLGQLMSLCLAYFPLHWLFCLSSLLVCLWQLRERVSKSQNSLGSAELMCFIHNRLYQWYGILWVQLNSTVMWIIGAKRKPEDYLTEFPDFTK